MTTAKPSRTRFDILARGLKRERGTMNAAEKRWSEALSSDPDVIRWWFEAITFRYSHPAEGQPSRFTADFMVLMRDGTVCFDDVKAGGYDDFAAGCRIAACAEQFWLFKFRRVMPVAKKHGGGWKVREC